MNRANSAAAKKRVNLKISFYAICYLLHGSVALKHKTLVKLSPVAAGFSSLKGIFYLTKKQEAV